VRTAIITGSGGQDGTLLSHFLTSLGYKVVGLTHGVGAVNLADAAAVAALVADEQPDEVYHLAAYHHSAQDKLVDDRQVLEASWDIHVRAAGNLLDAVRARWPETRVFYASSCHIFGEPLITPQDENTSCRPTGLYGITKLAGSHLCRYYRQHRGVFVAVGILFNHESPLRGPQFVSKKIAHAAAAIAVGRQHQLVLGDLDAEIDWGFAGDYVSAMHAILQLDQPDDFVIASGEKHSVREFVELAFGQLGLDWRQHVRVEAGLLRGTTRPTLMGDASKLRRATGWKPATSFPGLVRLMVDAELERVGR
jgi:GDPmannose 4,6-dehydratase